MIQIDQHARGAVLLIRAQPGARQNEIRGEQEGALKVAVTQAPEKGKANRAIIQFLAKSLGLRRSQFELLSGETSPQKRLLITGITVADLRGKLEQ